MDLNQTFHLGSIMKDRSYDPSHPLANVLTMELHLSPAGEVVNKHCSPPHPLSPEYIEERKDMFYLMTHATHFIYGYMVPYN